MRPLSEMLAMARGIAARVLLLLAAAALVGCGGPRHARLVLEDDEFEAALDPDATRRQSVVPEVAKKTVARAGSANPVAVPGGSGKAGDPVYSTSFAIELAKLALVESGVPAQECEARGVQVTYFEGVYTVCFPRPDDQMSAEDYKVLIAERDSRILKIITKAE
jgi:hypothetical protein